MQAQMKNNLVEIYERVMPGELEAQGDDNCKSFLESISGKKVELVFVGRDAFEKNDNNFWLPNDLWEEIQIWRS